MREFYTDVIALLKRRKIKLILVEKGSRVEKFNQDYQRNFYRLARLHRGTFSALEQQALDITNNTRNKNIKMTPVEALAKPDAQLVKTYNAGREGMKPYKDVEPAPQKHPPDFEDWAHQPGVQVVPRASLQQSGVHDPGRAAEAATRRPQKDPPKVLGARRVAPPGSAASRH